jgi:hypothetical protein
MSGLHDSVRRSACPTDSKILGFALQPKTSAFQSWPRNADRASIKAQIQSERHAIPKDCRIVVTSILGGLHHEYCRRLPHDLISGSNLFLRTTTVNWWRNAMISTCMSAWPRSAVRRELNVINIRSSTAPRRVATLCVQVQHF